MSASKRQFSDQGLVWNTVGAELGRLDALSPSGDLAAVDERLDADWGVVDALAELEKFSPNLTAPTCGQLNSRKHQVKFVAGFQ